jgi:hypothetical protein
LIYWLVRNLDPNTVRIQVKSVVKFVLFMLLVTLIRLPLAWLQQKFLGAEAVNLATMPPVWSLFLVGWEDMFFVVPLYYIQRIDKEKKVFPYLALIMSVWFGFGHLYQGIFAVFVTALYPVFISLKYGKRVGFGTVMVCHVIYDLMTYLSMWSFPKITPYLN